MEKAEIIAHYESVWGKGWSFVSFPKSTEVGLPSEFSIVEFPPRASRQMWTYATCGMSFGRIEDRLELHIFSNEERKDVSEILAACAHYHITGHPLGVGHTVNFGRPWAPGSICDFGLISLPYLDGPSLEKMQTKSLENISFLWLIPITRAEVDFKKKHGLEKLEQAFEEANFNYANSLRISVC